MTKSSTSACFWMSTTEEDKAMPRWRNEAKTMHAEVLDMTITWGRWPFLCATCSLFEWSSDGSMCFLFLDVEGEENPVVPIAPFTAAFVACCMLTEFLWSPWKRDLLSSLPSKFLQSIHLQFSEHSILAWKHSQYFWRHPDFLQWHPLLCFPTKGRSLDTSWQFHGL